MKSPQRILAGFARDLKQHGRKSARKNRYVFISRQPYKHRFLREGYIYHTIKNQPHPSMRLIEAENQNPLQAKLVQPLSAESAPPCRKAFIAAAFPSSHARSHSVMQPMYLSAENMHVVWMPFFSEA